MTRLIIALIFSLLTSTVVLADLDQAPEWGDLGPTLYPGDVNRQMVYNYTYCLWALGLSYETTVYIVDSVRVETVPAFDDSYNAAEIVKVFRMCSAAMLPKFIRGLELNSTAIPEGDCAGNIIDILEGHTLIPQLVDDPPVVTQAASLRTQRGNAASISRRGYPLGDYMWVGMSLDKNDRGSNQGFDT